MFTTELQELKAQSATDIATFVEVVWVIGMGSGTPKEQFGDATTKGPRRTGKLHTQHRKQTKAKTLFLR